MMSISSMNFVAAACTSTCAAHISNHVANHHNVHRIWRATHSALGKVKPFDNIIRKSAHNSSIQYALEKEEDEQDSLHHTLRWATAVLAAACLHLGSSPAADAFDLASASEDKLLGIIRTIETRLDSTITSFRSIAAPSLDPDAASKQHQVAEALIREVYEVVDRNFDDSRNAGFDINEWKQYTESILQRPLRTTPDVYSAIREMLSRLHDPYSRFLGPEEFSAMAKYDVSGVGVNLGTLEDLVSKTGLSPVDLKTESTPLDASLQNKQYTSSGQNPRMGVWVVGIIRGSLGDSAGIKQGDQLISIDGVSLQDQTPFQVASLLSQGKEEEINDVLSHTSNNSNITTSNKRSGTTGDVIGLNMQSNNTTVQLVVQHLDGTKDTVTLQRPEKTKTPSPVTYRLETTSSNGGDAVGYIKLSSFNARAQKEISKAIGQLEDKGATRFVLDMRGNRGGLVSEGIEIARLFLDENDIIVQTRGKSRQSSAPIRAPGPPLTAAPLIVLVDSHTASASEILAGALQDNCRSVLVGTNTYGKGLIQSVYELGDGSGMVLTVGKYVTPNGTDIDYEGLHADFSSMPASQDVDKALQTCRIRKNNNISSG